MDVLPSGERPEQEFEFLEAVQNGLKRADCSIHILANEYGPVLQSNRFKSITRYQYESATELSYETKGNFKRFIWHLPDETKPLQDTQQEFINQIQNAISKDMMFTSVPSATQLVEDIRAFLYQKQISLQESKEYDIAFISNIQDAGDCYELIEKLSENQKVQTLTVIPENESNYREEALHLLRRSRLLVVYFKETTDWALAFAKQIWKSSNGASGPTPILLIGEDEPRRNRFLKFNAPQLKLVVVPASEVQTKILEHLKLIQEKGKFPQENICPYTGLRPFNEDESIYFKGRETHIDQILQMLQENKFVMVTGSSGDGKSSLVFAGVIPMCKGGFIRSTFSKWAVATFKPERSPLRNLAQCLATELKYRNVDQVETSLSYGFSALVDLYKQSPLYCDVTSMEYLEADEPTRKAMKRQAANLLILADQFEEFFTNSENYRDGVASPVSQITVNLLIETIKIAREENLPIYVVFTMRSDYIGQCVAFRGFPERIGQSTYFVPRLKREEIQEVIQGPAILNGNSVSQRLVQRLLNDVGDGIDQLPVLQHALHQMWKIADNGSEELDLIHYAKVGGLQANKLPKEQQTQFQNWISSLPEPTQKLYEKPRLRNILSRHANELYETAHEYYNTRYQPAITKEQAQQIIKTAFTCLTKIDENRAVRNRMSIGEIWELYGDENISFEVVARVMNIYREQGNTLVQPFITNDPETKELPAEAVLDITHESLIRNWEKLIEWAEIESKSVQIYKDFKVQVNRWLNNEKSSKYLLPPGPYNYFNTWYETHKPTIAWINRYIDPEEVIPGLEPMEQAAAYYEDIEEFLRLSREKIERNRRLLLFLLGLISGLLLLALLAAYYALQNEREALRQRDLAEQHARIAERQRLIAENQRREAENQRLRAENERRRAEQAVIIAENQKRIAEGERLNAEMQRRYAENQRKIAENERRIAENEREIARNQTRLAELALKRAEESEKEAIRQKELAIIQRNNALITQSLFLASLTEEQVKHNRPDVGLLLSLYALPKRISEPDRPYVAEAEASLYFAVNGIVNKNPTASLVGHTNKVIYNTFSPDGKKVIITSWDKTARVFDVAGGKQYSILQGHNHIVEAAKISSDAKTIVTVANDFTARSWDLASGNLITVFRGHKNLLTHVDISSDGKYVATSSLDKTARIWDAKTGQVVAELIGHTGHVLFVEFSPDGKRVVTTSADGTAALWKVTGNQIKVLQGFAGAVKMASFSKDGKKVVATSTDGLARIFDGETGQQIHYLKGHKDVVNYATFSHNGKYVATVSNDTTARIWEVSTGKELAVMKEHTAPVYHVVFSPDDKRIATTASDKTVRLWDGNSFLRIAIFKGHTGYPYHAAFSPDSRLIAFAENREKINLYKVFPTTQELIDYANQLKKRELTEEEKKKF
ncbi:MAG: hypothetical protein NZ108_01950, partial [Bacteroidia bacterium]|nr:hypothetical protein [Bacteroidia bacterium]